MMKLRRILTALILVSTTSTAMAQNGMIDLPVNGRVRAMTYGYCLTGDVPGITHLLSERLEFTGAFTRAEADAYAAAWVADGYCAASLAEADQRFPTLRADVTAALAAEGFTITRPLTEQAIALDQASKGFFSWLGKAFKAVGQAISGVFSAGGSASYTYYESGGRKTCDKEWHVTIGGGGDEYEPTPFYPTGDGPGGHE